MGSIQILLGKTRFRRRAWNKYAQLTGTNLHGVPNFLYVTDTQRKARLVEGEFLRYRDGATFVPRVATLSGLLDDLCARHGDGRATWSAGGVALIAERLLQEEGQAFPWLTALGDPERVGRAAAKLALAWDEADRPALSARPELPRFLTRLLAQLEADAARRPAGEALRKLEGALASPSVGLAQWLGAHHAVILDDVLHPSPLRRRVLVRLARAWRTLGAHVVFAFESGRDLGGAEAGRFFDYDDADAVAFPLRPFQATRAFRRALFAELVAEGGEAEIVVVGADGTSRTIEPGDAPGEPEPADLSDRLYAEVDAADDGAGAAPSLYRYPDPPTEVRGIAHAVKAQLLAGTPPEDLWVAFPGLPGYLPLVRRTFEALGIPYEVSAGRPVRAHPVAEVLVTAARAAAEGFPVGPLLAALANELVGAVGSTDAAALARACRERGVTHGPPTLWRHRLPTVGEAVERALVALQAACDALAPLAAPVRPDVWRGHLVALANEWAMVQHASRTGDSAARVAALGALGRALVAVDEAARDVAAVDPGPWEPLRLARLLEERLEAARLPDVGAGPRRVQVVGMLELRGIHPHWLWIGGLLADDFPARPAEDFLLPRAARAALDQLDPADEARYLFVSALRNALAEGHSLALSWPSTRDDRLVAVSPLVEDLLETSLGGQPLRKRVSPGPTADLPACSEELERTLGEAAARGADISGWRGLLQDVERLDTLAAVVDARRDPGGFGVWDGVLTRPPPVPERLGVTRFEAYLACSARYFHQGLLRLHSEDTWDPDLPRSEQGALLHGILEDFLGRVRAAGLSTLRRLGEADHARWASELHASAETRLAANPAAAGLAKPLSDWHRRRWLAGLVDDAPAGLLAAWLAEEIASELPTALDRAEVPFRGYTVGPIALEGRADRVDRIEGGGTLVIDYKTGRAPRSQDVRAGLKMQGFVYLEAVAGGSGAAVYQELRGADQLRAAGWLGEPDTLAALGVRRGLALDTAERAALRAHLAASAERLAAGVFHPSLAGESGAGCGWCEFRRSCRVDHARNARILTQQDPRWQAPAGPVASDEEEA